MGGVSEKYGVSVRSMGVSVRSIGESEVWGVCEK